MLPQPFVQLWITLWTLASRDAAVALPRCAGAAIWAGGVVVAVLVVALAASGWGEEPGALTNWQALVLGLVQGATELLPISSSGHLILVPWLGGLDVPEGERRVQPDLRRRAPPRHARRRRRPTSGTSSSSSSAPGCEASRRRRVETPLERNGVGRRRRDDPGRARRSLRRAPHRRAPRGAVADRDQPGRYSASLLWIADRTPQRRGMGDVNLRQALALGAGAVARAHAGRLPLGHHDHGRPFPRARPGLGGAALVPAPRPDHARRRRLQGRNGRRARRPAAGVGGPVPRRDARRRGQRLRRDRGPPQLRAAAHLHGVRRLPPVRRGDHPAADRDRARGAGF